MKRVVLAIGLFCFSFVAASAAQFGPDQYAIKSDEGDSITNFDLRIELSARLANLPGQIAVGNPKGDVTLLQFYDLNCPFCREAAADVDALVRADKKLKLVFVPYAVLSVQSAQGALVELAAGEMLTPERYLEFHRRIYAGRGLIDAPRVLAAAEAIGLDRQELAEAANTESMLGILKQNAVFGSEAKLIATPAYIINGVAILGHPGLKSLQNVIRSVRTCSKVVC
ncbi:MAG: thioredoxin domain-containing protein [Sphingobacteriales bacterium]|jgi:protein-disulfide isomerase